MKHFKIFVLSILLFVLPTLSFACDRGSDSLNATQSFSVEDTLSNVESGTPAKVVLLLGQSNATGVSKESILEEKYYEKYALYKDGFNNVFINFITENGGNSSKNKFVKSGFGQGANADYFGPEVGLAKTLSENFSDENVFIIKYSWGGSLICTHWLDGNFNRGELLNASVNFAEASLDYLKSKGYEPEIKAVCWMQGESDAIKEKRARDYYHNTKNLANFLRKDLKDYYDDNFYFVDAGIYDIDLCKYYNVVNQAKRDFSQESKYNLYFDTISLGLTSLNEPEGNPDIAHFDVLSCLKLGETFGEYVVGAIR